MVIRSSPEVPALVVGDRDSVSDLMARLGLGPLPDVVVERLVGAPEPDRPARRPRRGRPRPIPPAAPPAPC